MSAAGENAEVSVEEYPVPGAGPYAITTGPDGALWFTLVHSGQIGRLVPGGTPTVHDLDPDAGPTVIVTGPDGALWFTEWAASRLGRITVDGRISEVDLPGAEPHGLAAGPGGTLWVALESGALARVIPRDGRAVVD